jgi:hypothetical protein
MGLACDRSGVGAPVFHVEQGCSHLSWRGDLGSAPGFKIFNRRLPGRDSLGSDALSKCAEKLGGLGGVPELNAWRMIDGITGNGS